MAPRFFLPRFGRNANRLFIGDIKRKKITAPRDHANHFPPGIAECQTDFTDTLKEAVFTDMDAGPDRLHQRFFGKDAMAVFRQKLEQFEGLGTQMRHRPIGVPQLGPLCIKNEVRKKVHGSPEPCPNAAHHNEPAPGASTQC